MNQVATLAPSREMLQDVVKKKRGGWLQEGGWGKLLAKEKKALFQARTASFACREKKAGFYETDYLTWADQEISD